MKLPLMRCILLIKRGDRSIDVFPRLFPFMYHSLSLVPRSAVYLRNITHSRTHQEKRDDREISTLISFLPARTYEKRD